MDFSSLNYDSFKKAWNLLSYFKFPEMSKDKRNINDDIPENVIVYFPLVGAFIGFAAYCLSWLLERIMVSKPFTAIFSAVLITLALEILTLGKDLATLMNFIKTFAKKLDSEDSLAIIEEKEPLNCGISDLVLLFSLFLVKIISIGILIYSGYALWLVVMLSLAYLIQGLVAGAPSSVVETSILPNNEEITKRAWIASALVCLIAGYSFIPAVLLALIITWFFHDRFMKYWTLKYRTVTGKTVGLAGILLEYIILIIGTILLVRQ